MYLREILRKQIISRGMNERNSGSTSWFVWLDRTLIFSTFLKFQAGWENSGFKKRDKKETYILDIRDCRPAWRMTPAFFS